MGKSCVLLTFEGLLGALVLTNTNRRLHMNFVNLTPHTVNFESEDGQVKLAIPASGKVARVDSTTFLMETVEINGVDVQFAPAPKMSEVYVQNGEDREVFPEPKEGVLYIVSFICAGQLAGREDVCSPGTGPRDGAIRFPEDHPVEKLRGLIKAVTRFNMAPKI